MRPILLRRSGNGSGKTDRSYERGRWTVTSQGRSGEGPSEGTGVRPTRGGRNHGKGGKRRKMVSPPRHVTTLDFERLKPSTFPQA